MITTRAILGTSLAAIFVVSMIAVAYAVIPPHLDIIAASTDGDTLSMILAGNVKQIPANKADDLITFWGWVTPTTTGLVADAITIHHGVNDHQAFGKSAQSSPVQSFHPHKVYFDGAFCVVGLESPKSNFKVQHDTITLASDDPFVFAATGTVGPRADCVATGLGITNLVDTE